MDGQNFNNDQDTQETAATPVVEAEVVDTPVTATQPLEAGAYSHYQDNTANVPYQTPPVDDGPAKINGFHIASLVLGILTLLFTCCGCSSTMGIILGVLGLIFGVLGNKKGRRGMGTAGITCSVIGLVFAVVLFIFTQVMSNLGAEFVAKMLEDSGVTEDMMEEILLDSGYTEEMVEEIMEEMGMY